MRKLLFFLFLSAAIAAKSQNGTTPTSGAKGAALGNATIAFTGIESAYANQAGLVDIEKFALNLTAENRFLLKELNQFYIAAALPVRSGTFALSLRHFGFSEYNEQKIGLAYARKLLEELSLGVQFDYLNTRIKEFGSKGVFTFEAGLQAMVFRKLRLAAHVFSPIKVALTEDENIPTILRVGFAYSASAKILIAVEVEKDIDLNAQFKAGLEYQIADPFYLRFGIGTNPASVSFGVGYRFGKFRMDVASRYHQVLGISPAGSFSIE